MIKVPEVLDFLVAKSCAPSTMGAQLDRLRTGVHLTPDAFRQKSDVEDHLLAQAVLIRCIDQFSKRESFSTSTRQRKAADAGFKVLTQISESAKSRSQGSIAVGILRAYQERSTASPARGLVAVYEFISSITPSLVPPLPKDIKDVVVAFDKGTAKRARSFACEAYADALLALEGHVRVFNKKEKSKLN